MKNKHTHTHTTGSDMALAVSQPVCPSKYDKAVIRMSESGQRKVGAGNMFSISASIEYKALHHPLFQSTDGVNAGLIGKTY